MFNKLRKRIQKTDCQIQTNNFKVFNIKRKEKCLEPSFILMNKSKEKNESIIEKFIITSIGEIGEFKKGHTVKNIYIRSPFSHRKFFEIKNNYFCFLFPTFLKQFAKNEKMKFWFSNIIRLLKNIIQHKER